MARYHTRIQRSAVLPARLVAAAVMAFLLAAVACSKKVSEPRATTYSIIFADNGVSRSLYIANSETNEISDSIPDVGYVYDMQTSPDGDMLYLLVFEDPTHAMGLYRYNLRSGAQTGRLPILGGLAVVDSGRVIIVGGAEKLHVVDADEFTIIDIRDIVVWGARGHFTSNIVVGGAASANPSDAPLSHSIGIYDYVEETYNTVLVSPDLYVCEAFPHPDERRVFVVGCPTWFELFVVDTHSEESRSVAILNSALSKVVFSASGDTAFVSSPQNPDDPYILGCPRGDLLCFDVSDEDYTLLAQIPTEAPVMDMALSPDGAHLYCTRAWTLCEGGSWGKDVMIVDTRTLSVLPVTIELHRLGQPREIVVGPSLKGE